jgi:hypothetical protein
MTMTHARESIAGRLACSGKGKLLRFEGDNYFVKNREDGKEVRMNSILHEVG